MRWLLFFWVMLAWVAAAAPAERWDPAHTRVFVVSMTRFKGGVESPWGSKDRLDFDWVRRLKTQGVPDNQIVFLSDEQAETAMVKQALNDFLAASSAGELLIFYYSSHGSYNPKKGTYHYATFDGWIPFVWAFEAIEQGFRGSRVIMLADCCYSGGIVELAAARQSRLAYACLSSTYAHNVGYSGWRFLDCLLRAWSGSPVVDADGNGQVELDELAAFSAHHMAFVAEGMPQFLVTGGFNPRLILSQRQGPAAHPPVGQYVLARPEGKWLKGEVTDSREGALRVHLTDKNQHFEDWLSLDRVRPFEALAYEAGDAVEVESGGKWWPARVKARFDNLHWCSLDGRDPAYDEWFGPDRLRSWAGTWEGTWENSVQERGKDTLELTEDAQGNLQGTWTGSVPLQGRRLNAQQASLEGRTARRAYQFEASLVDGVLTLKYTAQRLDGQGSYTGTSIFRRCSP